MTNKKVAYCGLFCGDCVIKNGKIGSRSIKLLEYIRTFEFQKLANGLPKLMPDMFDELKNVQILEQQLKAIANLDCQKLCKDGGGSTGCQIRECCRKRGFDGCWDCREFIDCKTLAWLNPVHEGANITNIKRICQIGMSDFLKGTKCW